MAAPDQDILLLSRQMRDTQTAWKQASKLIREAEENLRTSPERLSQLLDDLRSHPIGLSNFNIAYEREGKHFDQCAYDRKHAIAAEKSAWKEVRRQQKIHYQRSRSLFPKGYRGPDYLSRDGEHWEGFEPESAETTASREKKEREERERKEREECEQKAEGHRERRERRAREDRQGATNYEDPRERPYPEPPRKPEQQWNFYTHWPEGTPRSRHSRGWGKGKQKPANGDWQERADAPPRQKRSAPEPKGPKSKSPPPHFQNGPSYADKVRFHTAAKATPSVVANWLVTCASTFESYAMAKQFPDPPAWPCLNASCVATQNTRAIASCGCNIRYVYNILGEPERTATLKVHRIKFHPDKFSAAPVEVREEFQAKAKEVFVVANLLLQEGTK